MSKWPKTPAEQRQFMRILSQWQSLQTCPDLQWPGAPPGSAASLAIQAGLRSFFAEAAKTVLEQRRHGADAAEPAKGKA
jgi:hypothetical protein